MPNAKLKNYFHLHFLVFIAGFTAILGDLITIEAIPLVWFRIPHINDKECTVLFSWHLELLI